MIQKLAVLLRIQNFQQCRGGIPLVTGVLEELIRNGEVLGEPSACYKNYRKGLNKGLLKIMSKMGISAVSSYRGAQLFEAVGLAQEVVDLAFCGVASRIEGSGFACVANSLSPSAGLVSYLMLF